MSDDTLTDEGSGEDDSLSETIAAALEDQQGEDLISELGSAQDAAGETQETGGKALSDDQGGAETPGDGRTDQTEPPSAEAREEADAEPERDTGTADVYRQVAEGFGAIVAPYQNYLASRGVNAGQAITALLSTEH